MSNIYSTQMLRLPGQPVGVEGYPDAPGILRAQFACAGPLRLFRVLLVLALFLCFLMSFFCSFFRSFCLSLLLSPCTFMYSYTCGDRYTSLSLSLSLSISLPLPSLSLSVSLCIARSPPLALSPPLSSLLSPSVVCKPCLFLMPLDYAGAEVSMILGPKKAASPATRRSSLHDKAAQTIASRIISTLCHWCSSS